MNSTALNFSRVRRNHALEHATLKVLSQKKRYNLLAGYSDFRGFWIVGQLDTDDLQDAVEEALRRLNEGEYGLAISPNCGSNFVLSGLLAGTAAWVAMLGSGSGLRRKLDRWPLVVVMVTMALVIAQPLGPVFQARCTIDPVPNGLRVAGIDIHTPGWLMLHRVITRG